MRAFAIVAWAPSLSRREPLPFSTTSCRNLPRWRSPNRLQEF